MVHFTASADHKQVLVNLACHRKSIAKTDSRDDSGYCSPRLQLCLQLGETIFIVVEYTPKELHQHFGSTSHIDCSTARAQQALGCHCTQFYANMGKITSLMKLCHMF